MPPKQRITREMILRSAFDMFCREGMDAVNARSVAKALGCSTQPIFSYYTGMQDLKDVLHQNAKELFVSAVVNGRTDDRTLVDVFCDYVRFACEQPRVFDHLFRYAGMDREWMASFAGFEQELCEGVADREGVSEAAAHGVVENLSVYAHGLAALNVMRSISYSDADREKIQRACKAILADAK